MMRDTPAGFVSAVVTVKMADGPRTLWYYPDAHRCQVEFVERARRPGSVKVGVFDATGKYGLRGRELTKAMRDALDSIMERCAAE